MTHSSGRGFPKRQRNAADIEKFMRQLVSEPGPGTTRKHFAANIVILHNGDHAEVTSNFLVVRDTSMGPAIAVAGTYHDVVVRDGANWRFKSRRLTRDIAGESGLKPVGPILPGCVTRRQPSPSQRRAPWLRYRRQSAPR